MSDRRGDRAGRAGGHAVLRGLRGRLLRGGDADHHRAVRQLALHPGRPVEPGEATHSRDGGADGTARWRRGIDASTLLRSCSPAETGGAVCRRWVPVRF